MDSDIHWVLLEALIRGFGADVLGLDFFSPALDSCLSRNVEDYLKLNRYCLSSTQLYGEKCIDAYRAQLQVCAFLKKFPFSKSEFNVDRRAVAKQKLLDCESACKEVNSRLRNGESRSWVNRSRHLIHGVLGDLTARKVMEIITSGKHGPGSTTSNKGGRVTPYYKYMDFPYTVTRSAAPYALAAISSNPSWMKILEESGRRVEIPPIPCPLHIKELSIFDCCVEYVESDGVTFVPKDARTDRPIAVGSSLNLYLQLGVKSYMEDRLKLVGVDLTDQSWNQELARQGSLYFGSENCPNPGQFCTIDLASASDSISIELVKLLLPSDWWAFLDDLRHKSGVIDGEIISYEKFSAMGNGFTFPLESLIFWAVAKAASEEDGSLTRKCDIAVYGDDIIVRRKHVNSVLSALSFCGFQVNSEKSFLEGPFKESCGKDFLHGNDVRPFYLKREVSSYDDLYFICNSISRLCMFGRRGNGYYELFSRALSFIPQGCRFYLPLEDNSDKGLIVPFSFLGSVGIRPYLSLKEKSSLVSSRLLRKEDVHDNSIYTWSIQTVARPYKGRAWVRMWLSLDKADGILPWTLSKVEKASAGTVTRRNSVNTTIRVVPVLSWDGYYVPRMSIKHPIYWVTS
nr:MAG: hypothetical protein 3 [Leviviridae sp.]